MERRIAPIHHVNIYPMGWHWVVFFSGVHLFKLHTSYEAVIQSSNIDIKFQNFDMIKIHVDNAYKNFNFMFYCELNMFVIVTTF